MAADVERDADDPDANETERPINETEHATAADASETADDARQAIPGHLSKPSQRWLRGLRDDYDEWSPSEWRLAILAAESWDRNATARRQLGREGLTIVSPRGEVKPHPAVVIARDAAAAYARFVAQLGLDQADDEPLPAGRLTDSLGRRRGGPRA
ncbi:MAG TPA: P27 family phage terminase small subunit [Solirubrobacter sp.]|nr:P27 family phage terminase small subunit [Solirubrobacter sp.]